MAKRYFVRIGSVKELVNTLQKSGEHQAAEPIIFMAMQYKCYRDTCSKYKIININPGVCLELQNPENSGFGLYCNVCDKYPVGSVWKTD